MAVMEWQDVIKTLFPNVAIHYCDANDYYGETSTNCITFTKLFYALGASEKLYVALHECAHIAKGVPGHDSIFYEILTGYIQRYSIPWSIVKQYEQVYPKMWQEMLEGI